jgi:hypothetical protein
MSLEDYKSMIDKVPRDVRITFAGFTEPWMNKYCTEMVLYAHDQGHPVSVFTTGVGVSIEDMEAIVHIPFAGNPNGGFVLHLPDAEMSKQFPIIVLFLDEMNSAAPAVQAAGYQLILNRRIGKYKLPDNVVMVAAGNRESDKGVTFRMPTPLANRFVHQEMRVDFASWQEWAVQNNIHKDVVGYLSFAKQDLYDFDAKSSSRAFATPRSWTFVSELLADECDEDTEMNLIAGTVGEGLAVKFKAHRKVSGKMPKPTDILSGKITDLNVKEVSAMYSLVISMCYELKDAIEQKKVSDKEFHEMSNNFLTYMMKNFETELVVLGARIALTTYLLPMQPTKIKVFDEFHARYGKYILQAS